MRINSVATMACSTVECFLSCEPHEQPHQCDTGVTVLPPNPLNSVTWRGWLCTAYEIACVDALILTGFAESSDPLTCVACRPHHVRRLASQGAQLNPLARRGPNTTDSAAPPFVTKAQEQRTTEAALARRRDRATPQQAVREARPNGCPQNTPVHSQSTRGHEHYHQPPARRPRPAAE